MKKLKLVGIVLFIGLNFSCQVKNSETAQKQEADSLNQLFSEIKNMVSGMECEDSSEWSFSSFGSKACGGPVGYLAYPTKIDTTLLSEKIEKHKVAQGKFNEKWGIISDCSLPSKPKGIICKEGEPIFTY